jgi:hypothetical protein
MLKDIISRLFFSNGNRSIEDKLIEDFYENKLANFITATFQI